MANGDKEDPLGEIPHERKEPVYDLELSRGAD